MARFLVLFAAVCFGTTGTAQALGAPEASPVTVGEARIVVGAVVLRLATGPLRRIPGPAARVGPAAPHVARWLPGTASWLPGTRVGWLAAAGVAAYQVTFFLGVRTTGVATGTVVALGSAPVVTGLLALLTGQGRPGRRWAAATALAVAGLTVLTAGAGDGGGGGGGRIAPGGVLLALGAGTSYAVYTLAVKHALDRDAAPGRTMATVFGGGALLLAPALVLLPVDWLATPRGALAALWLGVVPTAVAYLAFARGLRGLSAAEASTLTLAEPLTAAAFGVLLLGEHLSGPALAGAGLLLLGLVVLGAPGPRRRGAPIPPITPPTTQPTGTSTGPVTAAS